MFYDNEEELSFEEIKARQYLEKLKCSEAKQKKLDLVQKSDYITFDNVSRDNSIDGKPSVTEILQGKHLGSTSFYEAGDLVQELYNATLAGLPSDVFPNDFTNNPNPDSNHVFWDSQKSLSQKSISNDTKNSSLPFALYQDPTETRSLPKSSTVSNTDKTPKLPFSFTQDAPDAKSVSACNTFHKNENLKTELPFAFYQDPSNTGSVPRGSPLHVSETKKPDLPFSFYQDPTENVVQHNNEISGSNKFNPKGKPSLPFTLFQNYDSSNISKVNSSYSKNLSNNKASLPFSLYQDISEKLPAQTNEIVQPFTNLQIDSKFKTPTPFNADNVKNLSLHHKTSPCKDQKQQLSLNNEDLNDENQENMPPKNYVQDKTKRELGGILTPASNVLFVPLEEQESPEESSEPEDDILEFNGLLPNETLIPPCNTEQFISAPFFSSTPCTMAKNGKRPNSQMSSADTYNYGLEVGNVNADILNSCPPTGAPENGMSRQKSERNTFFVRPCNLSVIIETSKESYKSSASSGSSASVTKLSQFDHLLSYDKSNITHKEISKADTFKEPKPVDVDQQAPSAKNVDATPEEQQKIFELSDYNNDPFGADLTSEMLLSLKHPPYQSIVEISDEDMQSISGNDKLKVNGVTYLVERLIAEGAYGKVYLVESQISFGNFDGDQIGSKYALKVCKRANEWELYICSTLHKRLREINDIADVRKSALDILAALKFKNDLMMVTEYFPRGTLLDLVNKYKKQNASIPQYVIMYFTYEILQTVAAIHKCKIVHADVKPDNILLQNFPLDVSLQECFEQNIRFTILIDFGRGIDMNFFKRDVGFTYPLKNEYMVVLEGKPWVYQPDWLGVLNCIHTMLFSEYMKVRRNDNGRWGIMKKIPRYFATEIWNPLFDELLNISSFLDEPNVTEHIERIKSKLLQNRKAFQSNLGTLTNHFKK